MTQPNSVLLRYLSIGGMFAAMGVAIACMSGTADSVHFYGPDSLDNKHISEIDFGRAPQRQMFPSWNEELERGGEIYNDQGPTDEFTNAPENAGSYQNGWCTDLARDLEVKGNFRLALHYYRAGGAPQEFVTNRTEVFEALHFKSSDRVAPFLKQSYLAYFGNSGQEQRAVTELARMQVPSTVLPQFAYLRASVDFSKSGSERAHEFYDVYRLYPKSLRAEPALIMAIRSALQGNHWHGSRQDIAFAEDKIGFLLHQYPHSRFKADAIGWKGRCEWLRGNDQAAIDLYEKLGAPSNPVEARWKAFDSIATICRASGRTDAELSWILKQRVLPAKVYQRTISGKSLRDAFGRLKNPAAFQNRIAGNSEVLADYLAFRIEDTDLSPVDEKRLLRFAADSLAKAKRVTPTLLERTAQLSYNGSDYRDSLRLSAKALTLHPSREEHARAAYIHAASLGRLGKFSLAISEYKTLVESNPPRYLATSARENLALLSERHGDPVAALNLYAQLGYATDYAYVADAELTPPQLAGAIQRCVRGPSRNVLIYTLGMRYFRRGQYDDALSEFTRLPRLARLNGGLSHKTFSAMRESTYFDRFPKNLDPVVSILKLRRLFRVAKDGRSPEKRAAAEYAMAQYMYKESSLIFYSPGLWQGDRAMNLSYWWNRKINTRADDKNLSIHCHEHECLEHVRELCHEVATKYPKTSVAPAALYTEGLASEHLGNLNGWWRNYPWILEHGIHCFQQVVKRYPHHPLAKPAAKYAGVYTQQVEENRRYR